MKGSALFSKYVIDGVVRELSPAEMLDAVLETPVGNLRECPELIVDETLDQVPGSYDYDNDAVKDYLELVGKVERTFPVSFAGGYTKGRIACALIDTMLHRGHFKLCDLALEMVWRWSDLEVGNMAAFYDSVKSAGDYIDGLGLQLKTYHFEESSGENGIVVNAFLSDNIEDDEPVSLLPESVPCKITDDEHSWVIYIPFDTSDFRLGGSLLTQALGFGGGMHPQIEDPDYFVDCYEVVRELVEDGILLSAATVGDGGLIQTLKTMTCNETGVSIQLSDIIRSYQEDNVVRILFAEVPGVVIQIRDIDFDYIDAELLLQDVVYFPLGHPVRGQSGVLVNSSAKTGIQTILESLISNQSAEGED